MPCVSWRNACPDRILSVMVKVLNDWFRRYFSDPQAVFLALLLLAGFVVVAGFGYMLAPVFASLVIAYLLEAIVAFLGRRGVPRVLGAVAVQILFLGFVLVLILGLIPLLYQQFTQLIHELPHMIARGQEVLLQLPQRYPEFFTTQPAWLYPIKPILFMAMSARLFSISIAAMASSARSSRLWLSQSPCELPTPGLSHENEAIPRLANRFHSRR
jgi:putative permease